MSWWKILFPKTIPLSEHRRIVKTLREELERKKAQILVLRNEKELLLRSSIKQEQRNKDIGEKMKKIEEKMAL